MAYHHSISLPPVPSVGNANNDGDAACHTGIRGDNAGFVRRLPPVPTNGGNGQTPATTQFVMAAGGYVKNSPSRCSDNVTAAVDGRSTSRNQIRVQGSTEGPSNATAAEALGQTRHSLLLSARAPRVPEQTVLFGASTHPSSILRQEPWNCPVLFAPMGAGNESLSNTRPATAPSNKNVDHATMVALGHSPSYRGDPFLVANRSANIPHALNCSVFIVNLPATLTVHRLIIALHGMGPLGRVFAIHINAPEHARGHHGCAAKVVFFERDAAHHFMLLCRQRGFFVDGQQAHVMWNRVKTAENPTLVHSDASRVLLIGGPPAFVNPRTLTEFFKTKLDFQVDEIITRIYGGASGTSVLEYRFGSYRCQAQAAKMALDREFPHIQCFFTADPLESGVWNALEYHKFPKALPVP